MGDASQDWPGSAPQDQGQSAGRISPWLRWILLGPALFALLYACSLLGLFMAPQVTFADTRSGLPADYSPWPFTVIRPVRPELAQEVLDDLGRYPEIYPTSAPVSPTPSRPPGTATASPSFTATVSPTPTPTPARSPSPSPTSTVAVATSPTATISPTRGLTASATVTPTRGVTPSPTATMTPSRTSPAPSDWYNANWRLRKRITIRASRVAGTLSGFPVLISLGADGDLAADAQEDGDDILFTAANGTTKLSHEVEAFNGGNGRLVAWVKVPNLSASADTALFVYYSNASASNQQDPAGVWDSGFRGVWHLADALTGQPATVKDSTGFANHGAALEGMGHQSQVGGQVDGALSFDGIDESVVVPNHASLQIEGQITLETWMSRPASDSGVILMKDWGSQLNYSLVASYPSGGHLEFYYDRADEGSVEQRYTSANPVLGVGSWQHVAATFIFGDGASCRLYVNGSTVPGSWTSGDGSLPADIIDLANLNFASSQDNPLQTELDEIRISSVVRSPAWIATEFNNQSSPSTFYLLGTEEVLP